MEYLGHYDAETGREQLLKEHLDHVASLAAQFAAAFDAEELGEIAGLYHDIGKYSARFQAYLRGERGSGGDHSTGGAQLLYQKRQPLICLAAWAIAGHHGGLPDFGGEFDGEGSATFCGRMKKKLPDFAAWQEDECGPIELRHMPSMLQSPDIYQLQFFTRMLFSCLVDADFLDTESFYQSCLPEAQQTAGEKSRHGFDALVTLKDRFDEEVRTRFFDESGKRYHEPINAHRREILRACLREGDEGIERLYRLTVPTGGGKTIASLGFSLHRAVRAGSDVRRIIYVIPYTSIIEQNARVFQDFLGEKNVVVHYANASYDDEREDGRRQRLATENWDAPLIVTTNVQFFSSLYASRTSQCRKLHNIAQSLIIFDEAQMIPLGFLKPCVTAIRTLVERYGCTAVLCTATQPALGPFFGNRENGMKELCPHIEAQFAFFSRVTFDVRPQRCTPEYLAQEITQKPQVLVVVNSKRMARHLYETMPEREGTFHLSTNLCAAHRTRVIDEIRTRLKNHQTCRVISTSLIEAGVDIDFPLVYRELTGLDSILQAAGRCNREGKRPREDSIVTVFRMEGSRMPFELDRRGKVADSIFDLYAARLSHPDAVNAYFRELYDLSGEKALDKKEILKLCNQSMPPLKTIDQKFQLIDDKSVPVFIPFDEEAKSLLEQLKERQGAGSRALLRRAGVYTVGVPSDFDGKRVTPFQRLFEAGAIVPLWENSTALYVLVDMSLYDETALGLNLDISDGQAIVF